jgi:alginate O-acetyltransferase complex protein AlgI
VIFNSLVFAVFMAVVLAIHHSPLSWRARKLALTVESYLFYAAWNPPFIALLAISTVVDWFVAGAMHRSADPRRRKHLLWLSLSTNLGILAAFKYASFMLDNFVAGCEALGIAYTPPEWNVVVPVGVSFYTFQTLSYTIDVYRGRLQPARTFEDFALFVTFFPQLVAGPIVRASEFLFQLEEPRRGDARQIGWGASLVAIGLFEKTVLADGFSAPVVDLVYRPGAMPGMADAWLGTLAFSAQIFFDFAGYSLAAIGVALALGFSLPDNFRAPYAAVGFSDFWRRWHISLSSWLRDYLYISLGGNRRGKVRTYVNLAATMLLGGLWHGAAWTYVVWGGLHGAYLVVERAWEFLLARWGLDLGRPGRFAGWALTYVAVLLAWVFFRAADFDTAFHISKAMFGLASGGGERLVSAPHAASVLGVTAVMLVGHRVAAHRSWEELLGALPWPLRALALALIVAAIALAAGQSRDFIYFQF